MNDIATNLILKIENHAFGPKTAIFRNARSPGTLRLEADRLEPFVSQPLDDFVGIKSFDRSAEQ